MDKVALSEASIFGIKESDVRSANTQEILFRSKYLASTDLTKYHLIGQQYSWTSSIFYFGYLFAQYPSSILMQKLSIGRYFGVMNMLWGVATTCCVATNSFATLAVCRFFLGVFETCLTPILTILIGQYWTQNEQALRACIWWAGGEIGAFISDSVTYAVSGGAFEGSKYATWQVCFSFLLSDFSLALIDLDCIPCLWSCQHCMGRCAVFFCRPRRRRHGF
jgi:MFS family permease